MKIGTGCFTGTMGGGLYKASTLDGKEAEPLHMAAYRGHGIIAIIGMIMIIGIIVSKQKNNECKIETGDIFQGPSGGRTRRERKAEPLHKAAYRGHGIIG